MKRLDGSFENALVFGRCFTVESLEIIKQNGGEALEVSAFPWTDQGYIEIKYRQQKPVISTKKLFGFSKELSECRKTR